jgi:hypothetical protein
MTARRLPGLKKEKNRQGKEIGSWCIEHKGKWINLKTKNVEKARARRLEALNGKRDFKNDDTDDVAGIIAAVDGVGTAAPPQAAVVETAPAEPSAPPQAPLQGAAGAVAAAVTEAVGGASSAPASSTPAPAPVGAAGSATAGSLADVVAAAVGAPADPNAPPPEMPDVPPELVEELLGGAADALVTLQLLLQAYGEKLALKVVASPVQHTNKALERGRKLHVMWMRALLPPDLLKIPPWLAAIAVVAAGTIPEQLKDAKPIEEEGADGKPKLASVPPET